MAHKFFVAGTDTEVGKSFCSAALLQAAQQLGSRSLGLKPVAAGADLDEGFDPTRPTNEDARLLMRHSSVELSYEQVNPVLLQEPIAPHIAAEREQRNLNVTRLAGYCRGALMTPADFVLVEGAGGWRVPLNRAETLADLAKELKLPVILIVGMRLGCINHALLSAEAIYADGLPLAGWIANAVDPQMRCYEENLATLRERIRAPLLAEIPYLDRPDDPKLEGRIHDAAQKMLPFVNHLLSKN